jgi:glutathione S-transferase
MDEFVVYGIPGSPYLRAVLLAFEEKRVPWRLSPLQFGEHKQAAYRERQPFGRIPALEHGAFRLYETQAILRYLDRLYPTPSLTPSDPKREARMNQIIGITDWYLMPQVSGPITFQRLVAPRVGLPVDEARLEAALPNAKICIDELARLLGEQEFMAGPSLSLADLIAAPQLVLFPHCDEGAKLLEPHTALRGWIERMNARPSLQATTWDRLTALAQAA